MTPDPRASKLCLSCGREITWRKKWAANWEQVRYCSERCRRAPPSDSGVALESTILALLENRARGASICPSEAARAVFDAAQWRREMENTRRAARRLVAAGKLEIIQNGHVVDLSRAKGPIRLRLR